MTRSRLCFWRRCLPTIFAALPMTCRLEAAMAHAWPDTRTPLWSPMPWRCPIMSAVARRALLLHQTDLRPLLPRIRQPVLLACGDLDPLVNRGCEETLLRGLPQARRIELSACGHNPQFTHPEILAELVRHFLTPPV